MSVLSTKSPYHFQIASEAMTQFTRCYDSWNQTKQIKHMSKRAIAEAKSAVKQAQEQSKRVLALIERDKALIQAHRERSMGELKMLHDFILLYQEQSRMITTAIIEDADLAPLLESQLTTLHSMFVALNNNLTPQDSVLKMTGFVGNLLTQKVIKE